MMKGVLGFDTGDPGRKALDIIGVASIIDILDLQEDDILQLEYDQSNDPANLICIPS